MASTAQPVRRRPFSTEITMNKDQVKGRVEEATGKVKEIAGKVVGNKDLEREGVVQGLGGKAQAAVGDLKADIKKIVEDK